MKAMLAGFTAAILIFFGAWYALDEVGTSSQDATSGPNVRLE